MPSHKSEMNNRFRIIFIKINIINVNFIKIYTKITHFITKDATLLESTLTKTLQLLENKSSASFLIILLVTKTNQE